MLRFYVPSLFQIAISAFLLLTAILDMFDTMIERLIGIDVTAAHGLIVYSVAKLLKEAIEIRSQYTEAREKVARVRERRHEGLEAPGGQEEARSA